MKKKYAFILMGKDYNPKEHHATFETEKGITYIKTITDFENLKELVLELKEKGVGAIEVCGAFGEKRAEEIVAWTDEKIAVGYVTHNPKYDKLFSKFFGD